MLKKTEPHTKGIKGYNTILSDVAELLESARRVSARATNAIMTATYWEIGRRIVEFEQRGTRRAGYGEELIARLSADLTKHFGRGFGRVNLSQMRKFCQCWPPAQIFQTMSEKCLAGQDSPAKVQTLSTEFSLRDIANRFPLPWSHYVLLLSVKNPEGRAFYEKEALRGGWSVRQLERQIDTQFYERTALSKDKAAMLKKGAKPLPEDAVTPEEEIKDPFVLEFLGLKDEYSENDLEEALIHQLENFLLELGRDFAFVGRQRRLRIGDEWYRVDLLFFHRRLRCLVIIDLKLGKFTHADAGQMHLYLNYAREHWTHKDENPPVGLILCAQKDHAVARYALEGLPNKVLAAEYRTALPDEKTLAAEIDKTRRMLEGRAIVKSQKGKGR
ncbi:MAG: PDDEXK nuclease domain-containing protein [Thermodesulfovibrionales bacterium]|nr:PDDEXK nuclease domain-containing protein [Thermodesulfovibrionales bacterium]